jgi:cytoskeletal protein CcmA (bactofilin family)
MSATKQLSVVANKTKNCDTSLIGTATTIVGKIESLDNLDILGRFEGEIIANCVTIREGAAVSGIITARHLVIQGNFKGSIEAEKVSIEKNATVEATIKYFHLFIDFGAKVSGEFMPMPSPDVVHQSND